MKNATEIGHIVKLDEGVRIDRAGTMVDRIGIHKRGYEDAEEFYELPTQPGRMYDLNSTLAKYGWRVVGEIEYVAGRRVWAFVERMGADRLSLEDALTDADAFRSAGSLETDFGTNWPTTTTTETPEPFTEGQKVTVTLKKDTLGDQPTFTGTYIKPWNDGTHVVRNDAYQTPVYAYTSEIQPVSEEDVETYEPVDFRNVFAGDDIQFLTNENGFNGRGLYTRIGTVVATGPKSVTLRCTDGSTARLRAAGWSYRSPRKVCPPKSAGH